MTRSTVFGLEIRRINFPLMKRRERIWIPSKQFRRLKLKLQISMTPFASTLSPSVKKFSKILKSVWQFLLTPSLSFIYLGDLVKFEPIKCTFDAVRLVRPCFTINADPEDRYFGINWYQLLHQLVRRIEFLS